MELPVSVQLRELLLALGVGAVFGLLNDLLRPLRRSRFSTALLDLLWCLTVLATLLLFALYAGRGRLRLFALAAMGLSGGLWLGLISPLLRRLQAGVERRLRTLGRRLESAVHFSRKNRKNL